MTNKFVVENSGRLDNILCDNLSSISRSQIKQQIEKGRIVVNGKIANKAGFKLKCGDIVEFNIVFDNAINSIMPENIDLDIVYEDEYFAVINKPRGMTVHPGAGNFNHTLANALVFHFASVSDVNGNLRPGIVHRIDKDTTGLLVVAKNNSIHVALAAQIAKHTAKRTYWALLEGNLNQDCGTISSDIARDKNIRIKMAVVEDGKGKRAITHFKVLKRFVGYSLVEFVLETGRTHQIRVHSSYIGHPVVGDKLYGYKKQKFNASGQLLHAIKLDLVHPISNEEMHFFAPLPDDFNDILKKLSPL